MCSILDSVNEENMVQMARLGIALQPITSGNMGLGGKQVWCVSAGEPGLCGRGGHGADGAARHRAAAHRDGALRQLAVPRWQAHRLSQLAQPRVDRHGEFFSCQLAEKCHSRSLWCASRLADARAWTT